MVIIMLIFIGYWFDWTGFNGYDKVTTAHTISGPNAGTAFKTEEYQPGKTLWDWLQLLIIPAVLAVAALLFNHSTTRTEQKIALDRQRGDLLQIYLDRMSDLLLKEGLGSPGVKPEVRNMAKVRTITILFQLDVRRIGYVFSFLRQSGLMDSKSNDSIVSLIGADLNNINFSQASLNQSNFSGADLTGADFSQASLILANLSNAYLSKAYLSNADLGYTNLREVNFSRANLSRANLKCTNLDGALLSEANLSYTNLSQANLNGAILFQANLAGADLTGAHLRGAELSEANFTRAILTGAELSESDLDGVDLTGAIGINIEKLEKQVMSLKGATMPNGSKHL